MCTIGSDTEVSLLTPFLLLLSDIFPTVFRSPRSPACVIPMKLEAVPLTGSHVKELGHVGVQEAR